MSTVESPKLSASTVETSLEVFGVMLWGSLKGSDGSPAGGTVRLRRSALKRTMGVLTGHHSGGRGS